MRFHIGCSFRPKNLLKYLFPFLLGVLAMLGIDSVSARTTNINYDSKYQIELGNYEEVFSTTIPGLEYSISTLNTYLSSLSSESNPFGYFSYISAINQNDNQYLNYNFVYSTLTSCPYTEHYFDIYGETYNNLGYSRLEFAFNSTNNPGCGTRSAYFSLNPSDSTTNANNYRNLVDNLSRVNSLNYSISSYYYFSSTIQGVTFNNVDSYTITPNAFLYDTSSTLVLKYNSAGRATAGSPYDFYFKTLNINGTDINNNELLPTYVQLLNQQGQLNETSSSLPYNYFTLNKNQISSFNAKLTYTPLISATTYVDLVGGGNTYYFGRVNHNNSYYTYEDINCTLSRTFNINSNSNKVSVNYSNLSCSSDLTNYDNIYIYESFAYAYDENNSYSHQIFNVNLTSNVLSYSSSDFKGYVYEPLTLQNGFKLLISSTFQNKIWISSSNNYLSYNKLSTDDITYIDNTISGVQIGYEHLKNGGRLPLFTSLNYGTYDDSMIFIYDNYTMHESMTTDLKFFIDSPTHVMVSFPVVINGQDTFSYYNTEGTITSNTGILTNYGNVGGNYNNGAITGDDYYLSVVNNFFDEINQDLVDFHQLLQTIFNNIPSFIKLFIVVSYTLFMLLFIFKEMKK